MLAGVCRVDEVKGDSGRTGRKKFPNPDPRYARWLGEHGLAATPGRELGVRDSDDGSIWNFATAGDWRLLTKDEDFVGRCLGNPAAPAVVWLRIGNCTNRVLFAWLEPLLPQIQSRLAAGERFIEVR